MPLQASMLAQHMSAGFGLPAIWLGAAALALTTFLLCRWRRRMVFVCFPMAVFPVLLLLSRLHDVYFVPEIRAEAGPVFLVLVHLALAAPVLTLVLGMKARTRSLARGKAVGQPVART